MMKGHGSEALSTASRPVSRATQASLNLPWGMLCTTSCVRQTWPGAPAFGSTVSLTLSGLARAVAKPA